MPAPLFKLFSLPAQGFSLRISRMCNCIRPAPGCLLARDAKPLATRGECWASERAPTTRTFLSAHIHRGLFSLQNATSLSVMGIDDGEHPMCKQAARATLHTTQTCNVENSSWLVSQCWEKNRVKCNFLARTPGLNFQPYSAKFHQRSIDWWFMGLACYALMNFLRDAFISI